MTAAREVLNGHAAAFALCRPPGHHAARDVYGGYCFLNSAAIAAQWLRDHGADRVAVLDVDYHHGNGTQSIFYERSDVFTVSLHADPREAYPYFAGYADETGRHDGEGGNLNLPLPLGCDWSVFDAALAQAAAAIRDFEPNYLVVPLGVDTHVDDPISGFALHTADFATMGARIAQLATPTVVVMEGGYALEPLGANVVHFLRGLEAS